MKELSEKMQGKTYVRIDCYSDNFKFGFSGTFCNSLFDRNPSHEYHLLFTDSELLLKDFNCVSNGIAVKWEAIKRISDNGSKMIIITINGDCL